MHLVVGGTNQQHLFGYAPDLIALAGPGEKVLFCGGFPVPEAGTRPGTGRTALLTVDTVGGPQLVLDVERSVAALLVVVSDDVVRARDDTGRTAGAQTCVDHLGEKLGPLVGPTSLFALQRSGDGRDRSLGWGGSGVELRFGDRHGRTWYEHLCPKRSLRPPLPMVTAGQPTTAAYSAASVRASDRAGCTRMLSARSITFSPAVTATAITEMSSAA